MSLKGIAFARDRPRVVFASLEPKKTMVWLNYQAISLNDPNDSSYGSFDLTYLHHDESFSIPSHYDFHASYWAGNRKTTILWLSTARFCPCCRELYIHKDTDTFFSREDSRAIDELGRHEDRDFLFWLKIDGFIQKYKHRRPWLIKRCFRCNVPQGQYSRKEMVGPWVFREREGHSAFCSKDFRDVLELKRWIYEKPDSNAEVKRAALKAVARRIRRRGVSESARQFFELHFGVAKFAALLRQKHTQHEHINN